MSIRQRFIDWRRERLIKRLTHVEIRLFDAGLEREAHMIDLMRCAHIRDRSDVQVARMERRMGLRARTDIKRALMRGYTYGRLPRRLVTVMFKICRLRSL